MDDRGRLVVYAEPGQQDLVEEAAAHAELTVAAVAGPTPAAGNELAAALGAPRLEDRRAAVRFDEADVLWLVAPADLGPDELESLRRPGRPVFASEPVAVLAADLGLAPAAWPVVPLVPLLRRARGPRSALEHREAFGEIRGVHVSVAGTPGHGSLAARLLDAIDLVAAVVGDPETVDASLAAAAVPERVAHLRGDVAAHLRLPGHRVAAVFATDRGGAWARRAWLVGEAGRLDLDDTSFRWTDPEGAVIAEDLSDEPARPAALAGEQIRRHLDGLADPDSHAHAAALPPLLEAIRLSCRTGQCESPRAIRHMRGWA
ncbi:MAG: hypothetical protein ACYTG1_03325 [Planctomycetota bacterium]